MGLGLGLNNGIEHGFYNREKGDGLKRAIRIVIGYEVGSGGYTGKERDMISSRRVQWLWHHDTAD